MVVGVQLRRTLRVHLLQPRLKRADALLRQLGFQPCPHGRVRLIPVSYTHLVQTGKAKQLTLLGFFAITASMVMAVYEPYIPSFAVPSHKVPSLSLHIAFMLLEPILLVVADL